MTQLVKRLHQAGLKATGPRLVILEALEHDSSHPTAEQLYETLREGYPSLSVSTVYQTLEAFIRAGLCRQVRGGDGRLRVEGTAQNHDHAVCRVCKRLFDVDRGDLSGWSLPTELPHGLLMTGWRIEYEVICAACQEEAREAQRRFTSPKSKRPSRGPRGKR